MSGEIKLLIEKIKDLIPRYREKFLIVIVVIFLYFFVVIVFKSSSVTPRTQPPAPKQHSRLHLLEFINGYRSLQYDFEVEKIRFGEKFLTFTLNLKSKPKSQIMIKRMTIDMVVALTAEYPDLESIWVEATHASSQGAVTIYGRAVFSSQDNQVSWEFR